MKSKKVCDNGYGFDYLDYNINHHKNYCLKKSQDFIDIIENAYVKDGNVLFDKREMVKKITTVTKMIFSQVLLILAT